MCSKCHCHRFTRFANPFDEVTWQVFKLFVLPNRIIMKSFQFEITQSAFNRNIHKLMIVVNSIELFNYWSWGMLLLSLEEALTLIKLASPCQTQTCLTSSALDSAPTSKICQFGQITNIDHLVVRRDTLLIILLLWNTSMENCLNCANFTEGGAFFSC